MASQRSTDADKPDFKRRAMGMWPNASAVIGDGPFAIMTLCGQGFVVQLYKSVEDAQIGSLCIREAAMANQCLHLQEPVSLIQH